MRTLVVGDVHGCVDELTQLIALAEPDHVVLVGDLFTKGPDPLGTWQLIRDRGYTAVLGNHDQRLLKALKRPDRRDKGAWKTIDRMPGDDWKAWLAELPLFREVGDFTIVHAGLHPSGSLEQTTRHMAISMRRWPDEAKTRPFWHQVYEGDRRVVFGHDAVRGLVRVERDGLPWLIGLDTGCVYGGQLSGYLLEEDRVLQVPAARAYKPV